MEIQMELRVLNILWREEYQTENLEKNPWCKKKANYQQTQSTYVAGFKKGTQATLVGGKRSHSTISAPYLSFCETAVEASTIHGNTLICTIQIAGILNYNLSVTRGVLHGIL